MLVEARARAQSVYTEKIHHLWIVWASAGGQRGPPGMGSFMYTRKRRADRNTAVATLYLACEGFTRNQSQLGSAPRLS